MGDLSANALWFCFGPRSGAERYHLRATHGRESNERPFGVDTTTGPSGLGAITLVL